MRTLYFLLFIVGLFFLVVYLIMPKWEHPIADRFVPVEKLLPGGMVSERPGPGGGFGSAEVILPVGTVEVIAIPDTVETVLLPEDTTEIVIPPPVVPPVVPPAGPPSKIEEIPTPAGYKRISYPKDSFADFIRNLPLRKSLTIETYNGGKVPDSHYRRLAVVDLPLLFKADLEQCADWAMRLRAEFYDSQDSRGKLTLFRYDGTPRRFRPGQDRWESFLRTSFANSNSHSLKTGCDKVAPDDLRPGDLIVQNSTGGIGHVCVVLDHCEDSRGTPMYLFGFSFMPAQAFHVEEGLAPWGKSGWFTLEGFIDFLNEYFPYGTPVLRRFP